MISDIGEIYSLPFFSILAIVGIIISLAGVYWERKDSMNREPMTREEKEKQKEEEEEKIIARAEGVRKFVWCGLLCFPIAAGVFMTEAQFQPKPKQPETYHIKTYKVKIDGKWHQVEVKSKDDD